MWFWLVYLLTSLTAPLALLVGRPTRFTTARDVAAYTAGPARGTSIVAAFRLSSLAPYIELRLWPWMRWLLPSSVGAMSLLGYAISRDEMPERVRFHEAIHTIQQASHPFFGPLGCALTYVLDQWQFFGWEDLTATARSRGPLAERIAYYLDGSGRS